MAGEMTVQTGWVVKDVRGQEVGFHTLPTMADSGDVDLRGFFRTVYRGKWILILTMAAASVAPAPSTRLIAATESRPDRRRPSTASTTVSSTAAAATVIVAA